MTDSPEPSTRTHEQDEHSILAKHLDPQFTGSFDEGSPLRAEADDSSGRHSQNAEPSDQFSSLKLQGGDVHRDLYRIDARSKQMKYDRRAASFSYIPRASEDSLEEYGQPQSPNNDVFSSSDKHIITLGLKML